MSHPSHPPPAPLPPRGRTASSVRRNLWLLVALAIALAVAVTALFLVHQRRLVVHQATERTVDGARLMEEHFNRVFRVTNFVLSHAAALTDGRPMVELSGDQAVWDRLVALTAGLPEPGQLLLFDAEGRSILGTREFPGRLADVSDRAYFRAHRDRHAEFFIGPMVALKNFDAFAFHISRAIRGPDGTLRGVVAASFESQSFTDFYRALSLGQTATLGLYGEDGRVILRQPAPEQTIGETIADGAILAAAAHTPNGLVNGASRLDGIRRLIAYRSNLEFGTIVGVGIDLDEVMGEWRRSALWVIAVMVMACAGIALMARMTFRALVHEEVTIRGLEATVRERTEEAHLQAAEAHRANQGKTKFLAAASHDLRQPLQAAGMFVEALAVRLADTPNAAVVDKLRQSMDAAQTLLTTLLDASTVEAGQVEPAMTTFPVAPLLANLIDQMEPQAEAAGLRLKVVASSARIRSDPVLLERMLRNLMVNALRYTPTGKVLLGCRRHGDRLAICVIDTGIGVPPDKLEAIFEDFTRLGDKGAGAQRGLGLGLGVVRRMAALLGHDVAVRSNVDKGSCFAVMVSRTE